MRTFGNGGGVFLFTLVLCLMRGCGGQINRTTVSGWSWCGSIRVGRLSRLRCFRKIRLLKLILMNMRVETWNDGWCRWRASRRWQVTCKQFTEVVVFNITTYVRHWLVSSTLLFLNQLAYTQSHSEYLLLQSLAYRISDLHMACAFSLQNHAQIPIGCDFEPFPPQLKKRS